MRLPLSNSRIQFPKILLLVSFISFSMDSLSECLYGMSDRELTAKNGEHIITSSKSFANLQLLIMFCSFICLIHKSKKFLIESKSLLIKRDQPSLNGNIRSPISYL